jgi:hypothetical protein
MLCNYSYIMIIYCFDLKSKDLKRYNTIKRRFYYELSKINTLNSIWNTKSVICVPESLEGRLDIFFSKYKDDLALFKGYTIKLERVY